MKKGPEGKAGRGEDAVVRCRLFVLREERSSGGVRGGAREGEMRIRRRLRRGGQLRSGYCGPDYPIGFRLDIDYVPFYMFGDFSDSDVFNTVLR